MNESKLSTSPNLSTVEEHLAFGRMRRKRTCPSIEALIKGGQAINRHLEFCVHCRQELECFKKIPDFSEILPLMPKRNMALPKVGQIRQVKESASSRNDRLFFRTPLVVVTKLSTDQNGFARVAQIHDEPELRGKGDIAVKFSDGEKFIESWNTYPLLSKYLGSVIGTVEKSAIEQLLAKENGEEHEIVSNPIIKTFRSMEVEVAYHFCKKSVDEIMAKLESRERFDLKEKLGSIYFREAAVDAKNIYHYTPALQDIVANWDNYITELPLAASRAEIGPDDSADHILILPCLLSKGNIKKTIPAEVHIHDLSDGFLFTAYCETQKELVRAEALILLGNVAPQEISTNVLSGGIVRIRARFEAENPEYDTMRIVLAVWEHGDN